MINKQKGFSLVELMIVVAIIGILASIAIPQYNSYIARSQVSEAMTLGSAVKSQVEEWIVTNGDAAIPGDLLTRTGARVSGTYVECIRMTLGTSAPTGPGSTVCATTVAATNIDASAATLGASLASPLQGVFVTVYMKNSGVTGDISDKKLNFVRSSPSGVWGCGNDGLSFTANGTDPETTTDPAAADGTDDIPAQFRPAACQD